MKKRIMKAAILALLLSFMLTTTAFAAETASSAGWRVITHVIEGTNIVTRTLTNAPLRYNMSVTYQEESEPRVLGAMSFARSQAKLSGVKVMSSLGSIEIKGDEDGVPLKDGAADVAVEMTVPEEYVNCGCYLYVLRTADDDGDGTEEITVEKCIPLTSNRVSFIVSKFGLYTTVVTDGLLPGSVSPQTSQTLLPFVLAAAALLSLGAAIYAGKRRLG